MLLNRSRICGASTQSQLRPSPSHPGNFGTFWGRLWVTRMYRIKIWVELSWILRTKRQLNFGLHQRSWHRILKFEAQQRRAAWEGKQVRKTRVTPCMISRALWMIPSEQCGPSQKHGKGIRDTDVDSGAAFFSAPMHWFSVNLLHKSAERRTNTWDCHTWNVSSQSHYKGVGKLWPTGQIQPTAVFVSKILLEYSHDRSFVYWLLSMAVFLLQQQSWVVWQRLKVKKVKVLVAQSCLTLCNPTDCSLPGSSVRGIL